MFSLQKVVKMLEEVVVGWREVRWLWRMRQNFIAQFVQLLTRGLCNFRSGVIIENWAHSVDQYLQQALQFPVHFINLLSILFRFNNFTGIQNTSGSDGQQAIKVTMTFLGYKFGFGKCFGASSPWRRKWPQYPCLENLMDRGSWWAAVHGVAKSRAQLSN